MTRGGALRRLLLPLIAAALLAAVWRFVPLEGMVDDLWPRIENWAASPLAPLVVIVIFVLAGLLVMPVSVVMIAAIVALGPFRGGAAALAGALASAAVLFGIGRWLGKSALESLISDRVARVIGRISNRGIVAVAVLRNIPVAPYSVVNLAAGASPLKFGDYLIGTGLGLLPGLVTLAIVGDRARAMMRDPSWSNLLMVAAAMVALALVSLFIGSRLKLHRDGGDDE